MKKLLALTIGIVLLLSGCAKISNNSNQTSSEESFENIVEKYSVDSVNYIENDHVLAVALADKIVIQYDSQYKEILFEKPNNLSADKDCLYFLNESNNEIYCIDYKTLNVKNIFSTDDVITFYWAVGNGNLFIQISAGNNHDDTLETVSEFIYNPYTTQRYEEKDDLAYKGVSCIAVDLMDKNGESFTRLYYDDSYYDADYISNPCRIGDFIYYTKNPKIFEENKYLDSVYVYSIKDKKESVFLEYETSVKNGISDSVLKDVFAYKDYIYLKIGINQKDDGDYEGLEIRKFDKNGKLCETQKINGMIASSTINFFNNKMYYNDLDGVLNSIDL